VSQTTPSRGDAVRASLLIAASACGFGAIAVLTKLATDAGAPLLGLLTLRYGLAAVILGVVALASGVRTLTAAAWRIFLLAGLFQALIAVVSLSALRFIPAATLSFLFYTYPAWVAVIARVRHSEPLSPLRLLALGAALAGIFVMVGTAAGVTLHPVGITLALVSALIYASYIPMVGALQRDVPEAVTATLMSAGATFFLGIAAVSRGELTLELHRTAWIVILILAVFSTAGAFLLFLRGLRVLGAVRTAIISTVEPFFTALLGAWLLAQPITRSTLIGGALIAAAVVLLQIQANGARRQPT
jgi:drug/metabolite transporter (DMT)-like permease